MHPLKKFLDTLKSHSSGRDEYRSQRKRLADEVGISQKMFHRLYNPNQHVNLAPEKALRLELATNGLVPANTTSDQIDEILELAAMLFEQRRVKIIPVKGSK